MKKLIILLIIIVAAMIVFGAIFENSDTGNTPSPSSTDQVMKTTKASATEVSATEMPMAEKAPIPITPTELLKAYKTNKAAADLQYQDKKLAIHATIASISTSLSDKPYLVLKAGSNADMFNQPQAHLADSEVNKVATLNKNQQIDLVCIGHSDITGTPMLRNCMIKE